MMKGREYGTVTTRFALRAPLPWVCAIGFVLALWRASYRCIVPGHYKFYEKGQP